jgi:glutamate-1-semialdehyde 2,1-aminomutase
MRPADPGKAAGEMTIHRFSDRHLEPCVSDTSPPTSPPLLTFPGSQDVSRRLAAVVPGGAHTYAKGIDQFPEGLAPVIVRGEGCRVWDVDGNELIEYGMGLRAVSLGHAYKPVIDAAHRQMQCGSNFLRPAVIELECAEALLEILPNADMVKFGKNGSDATSAAIRLSRAYTGRDLVARCADHPFFSVDDWFIGNTPVADGVPEAVQALTVTFRYNDVGSVAGLFQQHPGRIACLIMEAEKEDPPREGFLSAVHDLCRREGVVFVLDEMITGFRWHNGGAQAFYDLKPDLSTFGKALGNGFAVSALAGRREIMRLGGLDHDRERVFLLSLTHGGETHAFAAAKEVLRVYRDEPVVSVLWERGRQLEDLVGQAIRRHGLQRNFVLAGKPCNLVYLTRDGDGRPSQALRTLFLQETIRRGLLAPSLVVSYTHTPDDIVRTATIIDEALEIYRKAIEDGVDRYLLGRPVKPVWRKFN